DLCERLGWRGVEEVERGTALHLDRGAVVVGEHEGRRVEGRVRTPPALPVGILLPAGWAELVGAHDLRADPEVELLQERVVAAAGAAGLALEPAPPSGRRHPFVKPLARVAERRLPALALAGAEAVERDGEELDAGKGHAGLLHRRRHEFAATPNVSPER